jgi:hypothetical protein
MTLGGGMRLAFARAGDEPGVYVCMAEKVCTRQTTAGVDIDVMRYLPTTRNLLRLISCEGWTPRDIRWNAHGDYLAYLIPAAPGQAAQVGWSETRAPGEKGRVTADAFAWATQGSSFIAIDLAGRQIFRINADTGQRKDLLTLPEDSQPNVRPQIAIAPGGQSLAYTLGKSDGSIDLCLIEFAGVQPVSRLRKNFPGAAGVFPFWSAAGHLACMAMGSAGRDILTLPSADGQGQTLYHDAAPAPAAAIAPAWSATGRFIAFFTAPTNDPAELALLDCDTKEIRPLLKPGALCGRLTFGDETIAVEGTDAATIVWPHISHQRDVAERF